MTERSFCLFESAIGVCGIAWTARGLVAVQLPEADERRTRARLQRRLPEAEEALPPSELQQVIDGIKALLAGEARDLAGVVIDDRGIPEFNRKVYAVVRQVPPGKTITYGEIAERLGDKLLARDVGKAMGENPTPIVMPCHRVLAAGGKSGGFSAPGGTIAKLQLLTIEGAAPSGPTLFDRLPLQGKPSTRRFR